VQPGFLCEAFPAAQLWEWRLPRQGYNGMKEQEVAIRGKIVNGMKDLVNFGNFESTARKCADALDAVLAAFAPIAVSNGTLADWCVEASSVAAEGRIAIHRRRDSHSPSTAAKAG
jgi:hypothetical protein